MGKLWEGLFRCLLIPDELLVWGKKSHVILCRSLSSTLVCHGLVTTVSVLFSPFVNARMCAART